MEYGLIFVVFGAVGAFFMGFNNGANDIANAFASAVGSHALKMRTAIFMGSLVTFFGAILLGGNVALKLVSGLVPPTLFNNPEQYVLAMIAVLLAAGTFVFISTLTSLPVSSSHAIVGSLMAIGVLLFGWKAVQWPVLFQIVMAWVLSPLVAAGIAVFLSHFIESKVVGKNDGFVINRVKVWLPIIVSVTIVGGLYALLTLTSLKSSIGLDAEKLFAGKTEKERIERQMSRADSIQYSITRIRMLADSIDMDLKGKGMKNKQELHAKALKIKDLADNLVISASNLAIEFSGRAQAFLYAERWQVFLVCLALLIPVYLHCRWFINKWLRHAENSPDGVQNAFRNLQVGTSCYVAFAIGSNDVANSISPVLAIFITVSANGIPDTFDSVVPTWLLLMGAIAMASGITLLGHKVMKTLGEGITKINNVRGFCVDFAVATSVVGASALGMPVSTTHAATGAVTGSGLAQHGLQSVDLRMLKKILIGWVVTIPASVLITIFYFKIISMLFLK